MAWIVEGQGGRWADRAERAEMIAERQAIKRQMDEIAPTLDDKESLGLLYEYYEIVTELERLERIHRCENDQYELALEYFSESRNPGNPGNWEGFDIERKEDAPKFHVEMTDICNVVSSEKLNAHVAIAAARSHAKSTWYSRNFPIHQVVYRKRKYGIIISETPTVAVANMEWLRNQLKFNAKLRADFGPLLSPQDQANIRDNSEEFIAWHFDKDGNKNQLTLLQAASTGQALRGRNWNGARPDIVVCDDLEDARPGGNASTPEQRAKLRDWFSQTVMALGDPKGKRTAFIIVGTTVHMESLLMEILYRRSDFTTKVYRAVIEEPKNNGLWEQCRMIYQNHENPARADEALRFYKDNQEKMDEGVKVLWEEVQPIWKLMTWKWDNGSKAFQTEYMNNPVDYESMIFNPNIFSYWNEHEPGKEFPHSEYEITMGIDFAMGKRERGDYSAVVTTARNKRTDVKYVIDAWGDKVHPNEFMSVIVDKVMEYQPDGIGAESQMAQEFFVDLLTESLAANGYPATRVKKIQQRSRKELRIEAMLPEIESGKIQFNSRHSLLLEQLEMFGVGGTFDDMPDALEMSISVNGRSRRRIVAKPSFMT